MFESDYHTKTSTPTDRELIVALGRQKARVADAYRVYRDEAVRLQRLIDLAATTRQEAA